MIRDLCRFGELHALCIDRFIEKINIQLGHNVLYKIWKNMQIILKNMQKLDSNIAMDTITRLKVL